MLHCRRVISEEKEIVKVVIEMIIVEDHINAVLGEDFLKKSGSTGNQNYPNGADRSLTGKSTAVNVQLIVLIVLITLIVVLLIILCAFICSCRKSEERGAIKKELGQIQANQNQDEIETYKYLKDKHSVGGPMPVVPPQGKPPIVNPLSGPQGGQQGTNPPQSGPSSTPTGEGALLKSAVGASQVNVTAKSAAGKDTSKDNPGQVVSSNPLGVPQVGQNQGEIEQGQDEVHQKVVSSADVSPLCESVPDELSTDGSPKDDSKVVPPSDEMSKKNSDNGSLIVGSVPVDPSAKVPDTTPSSGLTPTRKNNPPGKSTPDKTSSTLPEKGNPKDESQIGDDKDNPGGASSVKVQGVSPPDVSSSSTPSPVEQKKNISPSTSQGGDDKKVPVNADALSASPVSEIVPMQSTAPFSKYWILSIPINFMQSLIRRISNFINVRSIKLMIVPMQSTPSFSKYWIFSIPINFMQSLIHRISTFINVRSIKLMIMPMQYKYWILSDNYNCAAVVFHQRAAIAIYGCKDPFYQTGDFFPKEESDDFVNLIYQGYRTNNMPYNVRLGTFECCSSSNLIYNAVFGPEHSYREITQVARGEIYFARCIFWEFDFTEIDDDDWTFHSCLFFNCEAPNGIKENNFFMDKSYCIKFTKEMNENDKDPAPVVYKFEPLHRFQDNRAIAKRSLQVSLDRKTAYINSHQGKQGFIDDQGNRTLPLKSSKVVSQKDTSGVSVSSRSQGWRDTNLSPPVPQIVPMQSTPFFPKYWIMSDSDNCALMVFHQRAPIAIKACKNPLFRTGDCFPKKKSADFVNLIYQDCRTKKMPGGFLLGTYESCSDSGVIYRAVFGPEFIYTEITQVAKGQIYFNDCVFWESDFTGIGDADWTFRNCLFFNCKAPNGIKKENFRGKAYCIKFTKEMNENDKDPDPVVYEYGASLDRFQDNRSVAKGSLQVSLDRKRAFINANPKTQGFIDDQGNRTFLDNVIAKK